MAIISFDRDTPVDYIPAHCGNRTSESPCVVRLKFCPYSKVQGYAKLLRARAAGPSGNSVENSQEIQKKQFIENVESVSGYFVNGAEVTDAVALYETAPADLIFEILRALEDASVLSEGQRKN